MPKLTDTQLVILSAAAQRENRAVLPLPASLALNKGAAAAVLKSLVKRGLVTETPAGLDNEVWRETKDGDRMTLVISAAGLEAIGVEPEEHPEPTTTKTKRTPRRKRTAPTATSGAARSGTKQALLVDLLKRKKGATVAEIGEATGWQPHSVRGAISGTVKKKLGLDVATETIEGRGRVYRVVNA